MEGLDQHLRDHIELGVGPEFVKEVKDDIATLSNRINNLPRPGGGLPSGLVKSVNSQQPDSNGNVAISSPTVYTFIYLRDGPYKYVCKAPVGTETSKPGWRIFRAPMDGAPFSYAEGDSSYSYVADDAVSYFYP